ncbi:DUF3916 domain-containing protein [Solibacillus isronensis]|uniref:DUF3916 domain-containing protein n=1 Tax=Solibacillus isronensis TaxID=412383 RepID=UPI0009A83560|nr:DUF3916 domain-containing protein [Solibacillus isronensis]
MKKQRGLKRKIRNVILEIQKNAKMFPIEFYNDSYFNYYVPASSDLLDYSHKVRSHILQELIDNTIYLIQNKPSEYADTLITLIINPDEIRNSQIIIHKNLESYRDFYVRNSVWQRWKVAVPEHDIKKTLNINYPQNVSVVSIEEILLEEEDGREHEITNRFFVIGEIIPEVFSL